jgi:hypothetical protein
MNELKLSNFFQLLDKQHLTTHVVMEKNNGMVQVVEREMESKMLVISIKKIHITNLTIKNQHS